MFILAARIRHNCSRRRLTCDLREVKHLPSPEICTMGHTAPLPLPRFLFRVSVRTVKRARDYPARIINRAESDRATRSALEIKATERKNVSGGDEGRSRSRKYVKCRRKRLLARERTSSSPAGEGKRSWSIACLDGLVEKSAAVTSNTHGSAATSIIWYISLAIDLEIGRCPRTSIPPRD